MPSILTPRSNYFALVVIAAVGGVIWAIGFMRDIRYFNGGPAIAPPVPIVPPAPVAVIVVAPTVQPQANEDVSQD